MTLSTSSTYDAATLAFFARLANVPTNAQARRYDKLICALQPIWSLIDGLYVFAAEDQNAALTNLIGATYDLTAVGSPAFTAGFGIAPTVLGDHLDTGCNPTTVSGLNYQQNSCHSFVWSRSQKFATCGAAFGQVSGSGAYAYVYPRITAGIGDARCCGIGTGVDVCLDGTGFYGGSRTDASIYNSMRDGVVQGTSAAASSPPADANLCYLFNAGDNVIGGTLAFGCFGGGLTVAQQRLLFSAVDEFLFNGYDLLPLLGQSNHFNGATIDPTIDINTSGNVDQWLTAGNKSGGNEPIQQNGTYVAANCIGHGMTFARDWYGPNIALPNRRQSLVVGCAVGSTSITEWVPGTALYLAALEKIDAALSWRCCNEIACILWDQGEADVGMSEAAYGAVHDTIRAGLRAELGSPNLRFLIADLADAFVSGNPGAPNIRAALAAIPSRDSNCAFASASGLNSDGVHFYAADQRTFAQRHWIAFQTLP